ncbi:MAG: hypothetical protein H6742_02760 [Alphaproteobacteria bacterium]|nr:hypothetical protein [Alphaproteobacteria bacterium]
MRHDTKLLAGLLLPLPLAIACLKDESTPFPDGLEPLEDCSPGFPGGEDSTPEQINSAGGEDEDNDWYWGHSCGYIHADVDQVWDALQDADVIVDRRRVSEWSVTETDREPEYDVSFRVHNLVEDLLTVEYDIDWRQGIWEQSDDGVVESVAIRWQKTEGVAIIEVIEGSMVIQQVDDGVTSIEIVEHVKAPQFSGDEVEQFTIDLYDSALAWIDGKSLPVYDD